MAANPELPIPISSIGGRYLLFSIDAVTYLRREHHICGVLFGSLPQIPQQNVFLGLPLQLMPEEVRLLLEKGVAYIVDDAKAHENGIKAIAEEDKRRFLKGLDKEGREAANLQAGKKEQQREKALQRAEEKISYRRKPQSNDLKSESPLDQGTAAQALDSRPDENEAGQEEVFFESSPANRPQSSLSTSTASLQKVPPYAVTPATSYPPFPAPPLAPDALAPRVSSSYPVFAHLHSKGYFLSPGLRFGCQYLVYPGDPLRFHSHFLAVGADMDQEIDLLDIVGGGRLGTGVKKGFLLGSEDTSKPEGSEKRVRTFCIEWAGM